MNISVQCCGIVILVLVSFFFWRLPRLMVRTKKAFVYLLTVSNICIVLDVLSVAAICRAEALPRWLVLAVCKGYLVCLVGIIFGGMTYICTDLYKNWRVLRYRLVVYGAFLAAAVAAIAALPIDFVCEDGGRVIYSLGPATTVTYAYFAFMTVGMVIQLVKGRHQINPRRRLAVAIWMGIWIGSAALQFLNSSVLVVSFGGSLGVLIIFSMIENPELWLDRESSFFQVSAMMPYLTELYGKEARFCLLNTREQSQRLSLYKSFQKNGKIFVGGGEIYMIFPDREETQKALDQLGNKFFMQHINVVWDSGLAGDAGELIMLLREMESLHMWEEHSNICTLDQARKQRIEEWKNMERLIREAIREDRVEMFYQPIYSMADKRFTSAEALMRLRDENGRLIMPADFIPVAEREGSIMELSGIAFRKVCGFLRENRERMPGLSYMEVNLSAVQCDDDDLAQNVLAELRQFGIAPQQINLEITESASLSTKELLLRTMESLRYQGVEFSLDDFGTGQSNLDYIATMPVGLVKFDRTMTGDYFCSEKTRGIMNAAIHMIHSMGMKIVAEGVETEEQFRLMEQQGIDFIQGFYFSMPLPGDEFLEFLDRQ